MESSLFEKLKGLDIVYRGSVELKHAGISDFYIDVKKAYGYPDLLNALADELYGLMKRTNSKINCVSGNGYGGIPLSTAISSRHGLKNILVRNEPKKHGRGGYFEGYPPTREDVVGVVDDVSTTLKTIEDIVGKVRRSGAEVVGCYSVVNRWEGDMTMGVPFYYLFKAEHFIV